MFGLPCKVVKIDHPDQSSAVDALRRALADRPAQGLVIVLQALDFKQVHRALLGWAGNARHANALSLVVPLSSVPALRGIAADLAMQGFAVGVFSERELAAAERHASNEARLQWSERRQQPALQPRIAAGCYPSAHTRFGGAPGRSAHRSEMPG